MINCKKIEFLAYLILISDKKVVFQINAQGQFGYEISPTIGQKYVVRFWAKIILLKGNHSIL